MNRRAVLVGLCALGTTNTTRSARAQPTRTSPFRIVLPPQLFKEEYEWFIGALRDLGWSDGRDFVTVATNSGAERRHDVIAKRMAAENPDVIITKGTALALAVHRVTSTVPIVMFSSGYPVEAGLADSLVRPGRNVTGNSIYAGTGVFGKFLELLREARPGIKRVGVFWGYLVPASPAAEIVPAWQALRDAARTLGLTIHIAEVDSKDQFASAAAAVDAIRPEAVVSTAVPQLLQTGQRVMEFAVERRLPTIVDSRWPLDIRPYPLMVYGASREQLARQTAFYVDRIVRGAKPGDLPIQQPAKFELVFNLKTAKALGLTIPPSLLLRADHVIE